MYIFLFIHIVILMSALHAFEWGMEPDGNLIKKKPRDLEHWGMGGNVVVWTYESREKLTTTWGGTVKTTAMGDLLRNL